MSHSKLIYKWYLLFTNGLYYLLSTYWVWSKYKLNGWSLNVVDAILIATGSNFIETHTILTDMMTREDSTISWSKDHSVVPVSDLS